MSNQAIKMKYVFIICLDNYEIYWYKTIKNIFIRFNSKKIIKDSFYILSKNIVITKRFIIAIAIQKTKVIILASLCELVKKQWDILNIKD